MSALDDIRAALKAAQPVKRGRERVILLGISAKRSIDVAVHKGEATDADYDEIDGIYVRSTNEFDGWAIRDVDKAGRWHDAEEAA